ncbi:PIN domain-containing protein [Massilia aurea]|uniref:PIN domain-containing protein n=1 Tax=Massilia aurea TaxID=373040 RepID=UPI0034629429
MNIFLDTNVFYNDWFLNNANFRYLFHYLSNEDGNLLVSKLVCQEAENIRLREYEKLCI